MRVFALLIPILFLPAGAQAQGATARRVGREPGRMAGGRLAARPDRSRHSPVRPENPVHGRAPK